MNREQMEKVKEAEDGISPIALKLEAGELQDLSPGAISSLLAETTGWHARLGVSAAQAHAQWKLKKVSTKEAHAEAYANGRNILGMAPAAAKIEAEAASVYLAALREEADADGVYRRIERSYQVALESMQSLKKIIDAGKKEHSFG